MPVQRPCLDVPCRAVTGRAVAMCWCVRLVLSSLRACSSSVVSSWVRVGFVPVAQAIAPLPTQVSDRHKLDCMVPRDIIGGAAARRHRIERRQVLSARPADAAAGLFMRSRIRWFERGHVRGFSGSAERRGSKAAKAKAEFEYHRDTFFVPGF